MQQLVQTLPHDLPGANLLVVGGREETAAHAGLIVAPARTAV